MPANITRTKRILAFLLLLSLLAANEWVLGLLFAGDGSVGGNKLLMIRLYDIGAVLLALTLLFARRSIGELYRQTVMVIVTTFLLFVGINIVAWAFTPHTNAENVTGALEMLWQNPELMHRIYGTDDEEAIRGRIITPGASSHPTLRAMMRPSAGPWHTSGAEGSRVSCRNGEPLDPDLNGAVWMFGGSTTYGSGVGDCETIASALNDLDPANTYINFGVESRNQNPEIDHLLLLLRKGYRPKSVIFLDGLNDIAIGTLQIPNLHPQETTTITDQPYYYALFNDDTAMLGNLIARLPVMRWLRSKAPTDQPITGCHADNDSVYTAGGDFHEHPMKHRSEQIAFRERIYNSPAEQVTAEAYQSCAARTRLLYSRNAAFIDTLASAFGFDYRVFFQPLTVINPRNPFVKHETFDARALKVLMSHIQGAIRDDIAAGKLPGFVDISRLGENCALCMLDPNHYTIEFSREIATAMLASMASE